MEGNPTHVFTLPSGIECEVREYQGKHQRILSEQRGHKTTGERLSELLVNIIVRLGSNTKITNEIVDNMLSCDKTAALVEARQFTMDFEKEFTFTWEYTNLKGEKATHDLTVNLKEGGSFPMKPCKNQWGDYAEMDKTIKVTLPKSGKEVEMTMLDGIGEKISSSYKEDDLSSHSAILIRRPCYYTNTENDRIPIALQEKDLDNMALRDIEALRKAIKEHEGSVDTELRFRHPEADRRGKRDEYVTINLLEEITFFFPSGAI